VAELPDLYGIVAPRLATQLYGAMFGVLLCVLAWGVLPRVIHRSGIRFWVLMATLGAGIFAIGFARGDGVPMLGTLRLDQMLDLLVVAAGVIGTAAAGVRTKPSLPNESVLV
jgi:prolipoprotein diacylglyceryltransferase